MAISRYADRDIFRNDEKGYQKEFFNDRDVKYIDQYGTAVINYPTLAEFKLLSSIRLVWGATDKLYNLSQEYYRNPKYWWVIAWYNRKPTEADFSPGDTYYVPVPLNQAIDLFRAGREG